MGRGVGGYVNLLSHSPVNTPCPGYRYRESREALLDEVEPLVATTPPATCDVAGRSDVLCPVQIHVQDPVTGERQGLTDERVDADYKHDNRWIDLEENVLDGYILIDDACFEPAALPDEAQQVAHPMGSAEADHYDEDDEDDANSHGRNRHSRRGGAIREDFDLSTTYPLANSHGNAYRECISRTRYSELYSELALENYPEAGRDDTANYSVANSHGDHGALHDNRERSFRENTETDRLAWDTRQHADYEIANSHSNYRVFYDSRTQHGEYLQTSVWPIEPWKEQLYGNRYATEDNVQRSANVESTDEEGGSMRTARSDVKNDPNVEPSCDIEECLVQIEESLLNIEQNLLHVQDLDIPELRNLLYKSPSIEKSLYEVQDLLYADGIVPVLSKSKSSTLESDNEDEEDEEEDEEEEEEVWTDRNVTVKDNGNDNDEDDPGAGAFDASNEESSDTANADESNRSTDDRSNNGYANGSTVFRREASDSCYAERTMNFVPNSLGKTMPRRIVLDGAKENIRLCASEPEETTIVDYNLNTNCTDKKPFCRDKCHSRTNSLDENTKFSNQDHGNRCETGKSSLRSLLFEPSNNNFLDFTGKARSEEMLQSLQNRSSRTNGKEPRQTRWTIVEAKTKDFRKRLESISADRCAPASVTNAEHKRTQSSRDGTTTNATRAREKSRIAGSTDKPQERVKESSSGRSSDKRKRKKGSSRSQSSSENALVPSKLISLSLSILLAALLQAVRCLTDLVEDAFRSVSYDRSGLLQ